MQVAFFTLGCKVNQYDTQLMRDLLESRGHITVPFGDKADCYIINTCSVTNMSDKKSRQIISRCKKTNPHAIIVVCGCFSQLSPSEVADIQGVDIILGTANRKHILRYLDEFQKDGQQIVAPADLESETELNGEEIFSFSEKTRAILKIEDGCRNFCSYCVIPYARGKIRSKTPLDIDKELSHLFERGFKEVVLTGIHLASYGRDLSGLTLADAIEQTCRKGFTRVRLGSLEPLIITEDFLERISKFPNLMPSFHLSLQSGSDTVLKRMNRHYTTAQYKDAVTLLRKYYPDCAVTTDIIVGFPGETEQEFEETLAFAEDIAFAKIHIFPYSMRKGTVAAKMKDQIPSFVKSDRSKRLEIIEQRSRLQFMNKHIGEELPVLFEQKKNENWEGYTENYLSVLFRSEEDLIDTLQTAKIVATDGLNLVAE